MVFIRKIWVTKIAYYVERDVTSIVHYEETEVTYNCLLWVR